MASENPERHDELNTGAANHSHGEDLHAAGRIANISAPNGVRLITAADLKDVKPIRPMLHKFDYVPIGQPVLATDRVRPVRRAVTITPSEGLPVVLTAKRSRRDATPKAA